MIAAIIAAIIALFWLVFSSQVTKSGGQAEKFCPEVAIWIVPADPDDTYEAEKICLENGLRVVKNSVDSLGYDCAVVGDPTLRGSKAACQNMIFLDQTRKSSKLSAEPAEIEERKRSYANMRRLTPDQLGPFIRGNILPQTELKHKFPAKIVHVTGLAGSGKTTLMKKLSKFGAIDSDEITDKTAGMTPEERGKYVYNAIRGELVAKRANNDSRPLIICGLTIDLSILADRRFFIGEDLNSLYERLRTSPVCDNRREITTPATVPPEETKNDWMQPLVGRNRAGYEFLSADAFLEKIEREFGQTL